MTSLDITDDQIKIALLSKIARSDYTDFEELLGSLASEFGILSDIDSQSYMDLIERSVKIVYDMYKIEGWIDIYRDEFPLGETRIADPYSIQDIKYGQMTLLNWTISSLRGKAIEEMDAFHSELYPVIKLHILPRGRFFLEMRKNPRSRHASIIAGGSKATTRTLPKRDTPIKDAISKKEKAIKEPKNINEAIDKIVASIAGRKGQKGFRDRLIETYKHCLVTGCEVHDILEAAHIQPFSENGTFAETNGLLLRSGIHTLFDLYLVTFDTGDAEKSDIRILIHPDIKDPAYRQYHDQPLKISDDKKSIPDRRALWEHRERSQF